MNRKPNPNLTVTIDHVVPRILDFQLNLFGFVYSISLDNMENSVYRLIDSSTGIILNCFPTYTHCVHYAEENDYEIIMTPMDLDL
jgi:hypothetical protein